MKSDILINRLCNTDAFQTNMFFSFLSDSVSDQSQCPAVVLHWKRKTTTGMLIKYKRLAKLGQNWRCWHENADEKQYLRFYPNTDVTGRSIYGAFLKPASPGGYFCSACWALLTLKHINPRLPTSQFVSATLMASPICGLRYTLQKDAYSHLNWFYARWLNGVELLIWGQDCGNWQDLPRAAVKSENLLPTVTIVAHSNIHRGLETKEVPTPSDLLQLLIDLLLPCQRQCASSKKGRNIQAQARILRKLPPPPPGLLNKDQTSRVCFMTARCSALSPLRMQLRREAATWQTVGSGV